VSVTLQPQRTPARGSQAANAGTTGSPAAGGPLVLVVGSGKGGVGKSVLSILLGAIVARSGRRVLLCDADYNLANLHVLLGMPPASEMDELLLGTVQPAMLLRSLQERLWLLPGTSGGESLQALEPLDRARLHQRLTSTFADFDLVIIDAGAGVDCVLRATMIGASRLVLVTSPEPAALTDAYAVLKLVHVRSSGLPVDVLVNQCQNAAEGRIAFDKLAIAAERFLRRGIRFIGAVADDSTIRAAVREPANCLAILEASDTMRQLAPCVLDRLDLPVPVRSSV
jgi:flagellar biosynthesis protein FlhG